MRVTYTHASLKIYMICIPHYHSINELIETKNKLIGIGGISISFNIPHALVYSSHNFFFIEIKINKVFLLLKSKVISELFLFLL